MGKFPATLEDRLAEITETRNQLMAELAKGDAPGLNGGWSVREIAYHLHLTEKQIFAGVHQVLTSGQRNEPATEKQLMNEWQTLTMAVPSREMKIEAPGGLVPVEAPSLHESIELLKQSRAEILDKLKNYSLNDLISVTMPHPIPALGKFTGAGWLTLMGLHELRHVNQIKEIRAGAQV